MALGLMKNDFKTTSFDANQGSLKGADIENWFSVMFKAEWRQNFSFMKSNYFFPKYKKNYWFSFSDVQKNSQKVLLSKQSQPEAVVISNQSWLKRHHEYKPVWGCLKMYWMYPQMFSSAFWFFIEASELPDMATQKDTILFQNGRQNEWFD